MQAAAPPGSGMRKVCPVFRPLRVAAISTLKAKDSTFTCDPLECVRFLFMKQKSGSLRMVVDARATSRTLRPPPAVHLLTAKGLASIEVGVPAELDPDQAASLLSALEVSVAVGDVQDCAHRVAPPAFLSRFFF